MKGAETCMKKPILQYYGLSILPNADAKYFLYVLYASRRLQIKALLLTVATVVYKIVQLPKRY